MSSDLSEGFGPTTVIDPDAVPPGRWAPNANAPDFERLREYVDVSIGDGRAHFTWTHAPQPPSRVYVSYVELD